MRIKVDDHKETCPVCGLLVDSQDVKDYIIGPNEILKRMCRSCYLTGKYEALYAH